MTKTEALNLAWKAEQEENPYTAYNSWCRGYEAGLRQALAEHDKLLEIAQEIVSNAEEYDFDDGLGMGISMDLYNRLASAVEPPNSTTDVVQPEPIGQVVQAFDDLTAVSIPNMPPVGTKLYTAPPKREWVGLTDDEIFKADDMVPMTAPAYKRILMFGRIIEVRLIEKNT